MMYDTLSAQRWIRLGIVCGLLVSFVYPALIFLPMPFTVSIFLVVLFGPLLSLASAGLYVFLGLHKKTISATIALVSNIIAGTLVTTMLLVQQAIHASKPDSLDATIQGVWQSVNHVHLGLDVSWDVYIFLGTFCFALAMLFHPKLGKLFALPGLILSAALIILNVLHFPTPPGDDGSFDAGPFVGLWYLAVTVKILFSMKWIQARLDEMTPK